MVRIPHEALEMGLAALKFDTILMLRGAYKTYQLLSLNKKL